MPHTYQHQKLHFQYPDNWKVSEEVLDAEPQCVSLQTAGSGFWTLHYYTSPQSPADLSAEVLRAMRGEYEGLEAEVNNEAQNGLPAVGYDMEFSCLDFFVRSQVRSLTLDGQTLLLQWQAEEREFEQLLPVFRAVTVSLLRNLTSVPQR